MSDIQMLWNEKIMNIIIFCVLKRAKALMNLSLSVIPALKDRAIDLLELFIPALKDRVIDVFTLLFLSWTG